MQKCYDQIYSEEDRDCEFELSERTPDINDNMELRYRGEDRKLAFISPNYGPGRRYPGNIFCRYATPICPGKLYDFRAGERFMLQARVPVFPGFSVCVDFLRLQEFLANNEQLDKDFFMNLCGSQELDEVHFSGPPSVTVSCGQL